MGRGVWDEEGSVGRASLRVEKLKMFPQGQSRLLHTPIVGPKGSTPGGVRSTRESDDDSGGEVAIAAAEIEERFAVEDFDASHFAKENGVVPGDIGGHYVARQVNERFF